MNIIPSVNRAEFKNKGSRHQGKEIFASCPPTARLGL
jgi:hypothetical protein